MHRRLLKAASTIITIVVSLFTIFWLVVWIMFFDNGIPSGVAMTVEIFSYVLTMILLYITLTLNDIAYLSESPESLPIGFFCGILVWYNVKEDEIRFGSP